MLPTGSHFEVKGYLAMDTQPSSSVPVQGKHAEVPTFMNLRSAAVNAGWGGNGRLSSMPGHVQHPRGSHR